MICQVLNTLINSAPFDISSPSSSDHYTVHRADSDLNSDWLNFSVLARLLLPFIHDILDIFSFNYLKIQFMSGKHKCKLNEIL